MTRFIVGVLVGAALVGFVQDAHAYDSAWVLEAEQLVAAQATTDRTWGPDQCAGYPRPLPFEMRHLSATGADGWVTLRHPSDPAEVDVPECDYAPVDGSHVMVIDSETNANRCHFVVARIGVPSFPQDVGSCVRLWNEASR